MAHHTSARILYANVKLLLFHKGHAISRKTHFCCDSQIQLHHNVQKATLCCTQWSRQARPPIVNLKIARILHYVTRPTKQVGDTEHYSSFLSVTLLRSRNVSLDRSGPDWWLLVSQISLTLTSGSQTAGADVPRWSRMDPRICVWTVYSQHTDKTFDFLAWERECWCFSKALLIIRSSHLIFFLNVLN